MLSDLNSYKNNQTIVVSLLNDKKSIKSILSEDENLP